MIGALVAGLIAEAGRTAANRMSHVPRYANDSEYQRRVDDLDRLARRLSDDVTRTLPEGWSFLGASGRDEGYWERDSSRTASP